MTKLEKILCLLALILVILLISSIILGQITKLENLKVFDRITTDCKITQEEQIEIQGF